jgi:hypothetical protein
MEITISLGYSCVCYHLIAQRLCLIIRAIEGIVEVVFLLSDCKVVSGLLDEDIMKDTSLAKREC